MAQQCVLLCSISAINDIFKYADDVTLLVPQHTDVELDVEFQNVKACAATNCLKLNLSKTKEIVFKRPRVQYFICLLLWLILSNWIAVSYWV